MRTIGILLLLVVSCGVMASGYHNGYSEHGYVYRDGLWYWNGTPYTRTKFYYTDHYGRYTWQWWYQEVKSQPTYNLPPVTDKNWKSAAIDLLGKKEENDLYWQVYNTLNKSTASFSGIATVQSGQTVYGRSFKADLYGSAAELAVLYAQQQARLTQDAQAYGDKAHSRFTELNAQQLEVLKLLAKGEAGAKLLEALKDGPKVSIESKSFGPNEAKTSERFGSLVAAKCGSCHGPEKQAGGLDLRNWPTFTEARKDEIRERINPRMDPKKRMPLNAPPLSADERIEFLRN